MFKATSTFSQARNIAMALTMTFAATTLTACGSDDDSDVTSPEAEMSSENQTSMTDNNTDNTMESDSVAVSDPDETEMTDEFDESEMTDGSEESDTSASDDMSTVEADESTNGEAETHAVTAQGLKFNPLVVKINPGDTVAWRNMSTHNSESIDGLIPEGAETWNSPMSENFQRTFTQEGIYVYKCTPHFGTGMGGAIIVGEPVNLEEIKNADAPGAAGRLVREAVAEAESM